LSVLLARDPADRRLWAGDKGGSRGVSEVVNDLDSRLIGFWDVLKDEKLFARFARQVEAIPLSRVAWERARDYVPTGDAVADAVAFFVWVRQSRQGLRKDFATLVRSRTRRGMNDNVSGWLSAVDGLADVHARLRRVATENKPALDLIRKHDGPHTLFYCDPPYLPRTRTARKAYREYEMTEADHQQLLEVLLACQGKVMLSGYPSELYDSALAGWRREPIPVRVHSSGARKKRKAIEVIWYNWQATPQGGGGQTVPNIKPAPPLG
jgi:DNA adenine methylase